MDDTNHPSGAPWRNFYGRFKGKTLRPRQHVYLAEDLAPLSPGPVGWDVNPDRVPLDPASVLGGRPLWLEIGFGGGEHLVHMAEAHPDIGLIGCEPFENAVAMTLAKIRASGVCNVAIHPGDVRDLFDVLPDGVIERAFLLYPDPWPKTRHHRRRFVTPEHLLPLARVMAPGAILRVATDIPGYVVQALHEVPRAGFDTVVGAAPAWHNPWDDWISTRYEHKALREGRSPHYLTFRRKAADPVEDGAG
ncbi:MAG: tRNA (guanosine(46)-N7)-methyltransferase TrmB [Rhodobacterales bacterium]|nr:tRNA (guanosine(46)-N7)-methyltransferase TrmB [Rhodobacterales bacterium]